MWSKVITNAGQALLVRITNGTLTFTKAQVGTGKISDNQLSLQTAVSGYKKDLSITSVSNDTTTIKARLQLNNTGVQTGFDMHQIGLFGKITGDASDTLIVIMQTDKSDYVPSSIESPKYISDYVVNLLIDTSTDVTGNIDIAGVATVGQLRDIKIEVAGKVDKIAGKGLSSNDYTTTEKTKLAGIASSANNYVHPSSHPASMITQDATKRFVTDIEKATWNGKASTAVATTTANGLMASVDKVKLDGIETSANNYAHPSSHPASMITQDATKRFVTDTEKATWNGKASVAVATTTANGLMASADKVKLDGVAVSANNYVHPNDANNRHVTDAEKSTWNGKAGTAIVSTTANGLMASADKVKLDGVAVSANNYVHPSSHPASVITQDATKRFVTDTEKATWNGKANKLDTTAIFTHAKAGTIHTLTGTAPTSGFYTARFKAVADFVDDDTFKVNNVVYVAQDVLGEAISGFKVGAVISVEVDIAGKKITIGGGGGGTSMIKAKQYVALPAKVENNIIAIISMTPMKNYTVDTQKPSVATNGDVWVCVEDSENMLTQGDSSIGVINMRFGVVRQHLNGVWRSIDAYIGTNGAWVRISNTHEIYGIKIDKNNSDPATRVIYTGAAVGMKPCKMNYITGEFDYGDWYAFICEIATPVMLNTNGTVAYELDRNNQNKKADGTPSDIANMAFDGNAMVKLKKIYIQAYSDSKYDYVNLCFEKISEAYHAYAFTNELGIEHDYIFMPMFRSDNLSRLRSIAGQSLTNSSSLTINGLIRAAEAVGRGYSVQYWSVWNLKMSLLWLLGASTNSQKTFGNGNVGFSTSLQTGTLRDKGAFFGYNDTDGQVKCLWSEVMWGDREDCLLGCWVNGSSGMYVKMNAPYGMGNPAGHTQLPCVSYISNYLQTITLSEYGMTISNVDASDSTYFCDGVVRLNDGILTACVGGSTYQQRRAGSSSISISHKTSTYINSVCASLHYIKQ